MFCCIKGWADDDAGSSASSKNPVSASKILLRVRDAAPCAWPISDAALLCSDWWSTFRAQRPENKMTTRQQQDLRARVPIHVYLVHGTQQRFISKLEFIVKLKLNTDHQHALINPNLIKEIMNRYKCILVLGWSTHFLEIRQLDNWHSKKFQNKRLLD